MLHALLLLTALVSAPTSTFYVAKTGDDHWTGKLKAPNAAHTDGPFATLEHARDAVRAMKGQGLTAPVTVLVRAGTYALTSTLTFTAEDSGTADCPVTYRAYPGEAPVLTGGPMIKGWKPYRGGIFVADLAAQGVDDRHFRELFLKGQRQILARFPNFDPAHPVTGGLLYVDETASLGRNSFHYAEGQIPWDKWGDISQAEVNIFPYNCWDHNIVRIAAVDRDMDLIRLRHNVMGQIYVRNRYFIENVMGALDAPGEWFSDWKTGKLYFIPPDGKSPGDADVTVPMLENLVEIAGTDDKPVQYLTLRGFRMTCARMDAVTLEGARNCAVIGNTIDRVGGVGINVGYLRNGVRGVGLPWRRSGAGQVHIHSGDRPLLFGYACSECRVAGNDVDSVGGEGVALQGTKNVADNNHLSRTGTYDRVCAGITIDGDENLASHNVIHDVPRDGIFINGARNIAEYNDIRNSMLYTADNAAIALRRHDVPSAVADVGNVLRYNRLLDTVGYGSYPHCTHPGDGFASPFCSFGIYLDGSICGVSVYGNIIARTGGDSVFVQFGGGNIFENNIFVEDDARRVQFDSMIFFGTFMYTDSTGKLRDAEPPNEFKHNIFSYAAPATNLYREGHWDNSSDWDRRSAKFDDNLIWHKGQPVTVDLASKMNFKSLEDWQAQGYDTRSVVADPLFVDAAHDDYRLRPNSPAYQIGFRDINAAIAKIGAYKSDERASWPLRNAILQREKPVVFDFATKEPVAIVDGFERATVGSPPMRAQVSAGGGNGAAAVTTDVAKTGFHSLKFQDAPGLTNPWEPHVMWQIDYSTGKVHFAVDVLSSKDKPADYYMEFRDWNYAGKLYVGPTFRSTRDGAFLVNGNLGGGGRQIAEVPSGEWYNVAIDFVLGDRADGSYTLTLAVPGKPALVTTLPFGSPEFKHCNWFGISSTSTDTAVFYVDNLILGAADSEKVRNAASSPAIKGPARPPVVAAPAGNADRLSGWWKLDEDGMEVLDSSGNGLRGEASEGQRAVGDFGRALYCAGTGDGLTVPDSPLLHFGTGSFTLEAWLCPSTLSMAGANPRRRLIEKTMWPQTYWIVDIWSDGRVQMEMADQDLHIGTTASAGSVREKTWTHLAITVDRERGKTSYYFNGKLDSAADLPADFKSRLDVVGMPFETGTWQQYIGLLSDLRIYQRALSGDEISRTYEGTKASHVATAFTASPEE